MSHTPKNWRVAPSITRDKLGDPIGFDVFDSNGDRVGYQLSEEDARLIAAAPELKEALEELMLAAGMMDKNARKHPAVVKAVCAAVLALAKCEPEAKP
jgi:hypothetical protein